MTPAEQHLWQRLRRNQRDGLHFRRQQVIRGYIADFYCHSASVIVEVDGGIHAEQEEYDADRDYLIAALGIRILRVKNEEIQDDLEGVLKRIAELCHAER